MLISSVQRSWIPPRWCARCCLSFWRAAQRAWLRLASHPSRGSLALQSLMPSLPASMSDWSQAVITSLPITQIPTGQPFNNESNLISKHFQKGLDSGMTLTASISRLKVKVLWSILDCYLFLNSYAKSFCSGLDESVLEECLQYLEKQLENSQVRKAMEEFFSFGYLFIWLMSVFLNKGFLPLVLLN